MPGQIRSNSRPIRGVAACDRGQRARAPAVVLTYDEPFNEDFMTSRRPVWNAAPALYFGNYLKASAGQVVHPRFA